jgi:hypothetical protein
MDQTVNGNELITLGTFWLEAGTVEVVLNNTSSDYVSADAVKFIAQ